MTVIIRGRDEWERILANVQPSPLYVTSDKQWFRNGFGCVYIFEEGAQP